MAKKSKLSSLKKIKIESDKLMKNTDRGTFFLIKNNNPERYISFIRLTTQPYLYNEVILEIQKYPYSQTHLLSSEKKKKIEELNTQKLIFINFESEFAWAKAILLKNSKAINRFITLSEEYSGMLMNGEIELANDVLDIIEKEYGYSLWLIKNRIALLQLTQGLESQKKYTQEIKDKLKIGTIPRFVTHWLSVRNEKQTSTGRYNNQIEAIINKLNENKQPGLKEYLRYHLLAKEDLEPENFIHVLRLEYSSSLIDYYEAFVSLLRILSINTSEKLKSKVYNLVTNNKFSIIDKRIDILSVLLGAKKYTQHLNDAYLLDKYNMILTGNFTVDQSKENKIVSDHPVKLIVDSYQNAFSNIPKEDIPNASLRDTLVDKLSKILTNGIIDSSEEYNELSKIVMNFASFPWTSAINIILSRENSPLTKLNLDCELLALKIPYIHPDLMDCMYDEIMSPNYEQICNANFQNNIITDYSISLRNSDEKLSPSGLTEDYNNLLHGIIRFENNDMLNAIKHGENLKKSENKYFQRRGYSLISHSYLKLNELDMACISSAECYINEKHFYPFLPLSQILDKIKPGTEEWYRVNSIVDFSIVLDVYYKHINKDLETERRFAYEDFLIENGMDKPSELANRLDEFDINRIIYYLRFICIETIMDTSSAFEGGSEEVVEERLKICRLLLSLDQKNESIYKQEINELVKKQVITSRRQEVDQSRIYVDIQSIKDWAESELEENFKRYIAYLKNNIKTLDNKATTKKSSITSLDSSMSIPENEVNDLLKFMIQEITEAYLSPDFGLDRFLSTRIRHGILEGHLIRPIQNHHLITKKEFKNGPYLRNGFWLDKLNPNLKNIIKNFDSAFSKFSDSYYKLISEVNEWLQINTSKGLFNFSISETDINIISSKINEETSLKDFIDLIITYLESTLIVHLISIRETLNSTAKSNAKKLLNTLQESTLINGNQTSLELQSAINQARTDLQIQFEKIIGWFVPAASGNSTPYYIEDAMMVAEAMIKESDSNFKISVKSESLEDFPIHGHLPIFVDIFVNIFENVVKRSNLTSPEAEATVWTNEIIKDLTTINFKVSNKIGGGINVEELKKEMERKMALLKNESYSQYLAKEKNSGLFKIHKSVMDFKAIGSDTLPTMNVGINDNCFQIDISVPFRVFTLEDEEIQLN